MEICEKDIFFRKRAIFLQKGMRKMEFVLATAMHRRIHLLNLLRVANRWLHLDEIAVKIDCSKKTVISDCQYIEDRWPDIVSIETSQKNGVRLVEAPNRSIYDIYIDIIKESNTFSLLEAIFFEPGMSGDYWSKKFFLSSSSLYRTAKKIDKSLNQRNFRLDRTTYQIEGEDERQIRYFFSSYFFEVYGIHEWPFLLDKEKVCELVGRINKDLDRHFNDFQFIELAFSIAVTITRERQGKLIQCINREDDSYQERVQKLNLYTDLIREIVAPLNVKLPANWAEDFSYSIFWWEFGWDNPQEKIRIHQLAEDVVDTICRVLKITVDERDKERTEEIFENIYAKHKMYPFKKYIVYNRKLYSSLGIQRYYTVFTAVLVKILKNMEEKTKFPWHSLYFDEILYEIMVRWQGLADMLEGRRHQVEVGVFSDLGSEHAQLLASFLRKNFREKISLTVQDRPYYELEEKRFPEFELNVTNFEIAHIEKDKLFIIEDIPTFKNMMDLRNKIDEQRMVIPSDIPFLRE